MGDTEPPGGKLDREDYEKVKQAQDLEKHRNDPAVTPEVLERINRAQENLRKGPLEKVTPPPKVTGTGGSGAGPGR